MISLEIKNSVFSPCLDELSSLLNNAIHHINYWVHKAGRYRAISILCRVHAAFFNCNQYDTMAYIPDETGLAKIMTALDLEFEKALYYHDKGYESDNDYVPPAQVMRPVCIYSVSITDGSFNPANYKEAQHTISPFMPR